MNRWALPEGAPDVLASPVAKEVEQQEQQKQQQQQQQQQQQHAARQSDEELLPVFDCFSSIAVGATRHNANLDDLERRMRNIMDGKVQGEIRRDKQSLRSHVQDAVQVFAQTIEEEDGLMVGGLPVPGGVAKMGEETGMYSFATRHTCFARQMFVRVRIISTAAHNAHDAAHLLGVLGELLFYLFFFLVFQRAEANSTTHPTSCGKYWLCVS